jgi:hypothetical protein
MGDTSDTIKLLPGTRFHLDFGFIRVLSLDFGVTAGHCIVTSYNGNNTFLLIVCAKTRHTWVFCQTPKAPPIHILERFLEVNGLKDRPRFMRMDRGRELWRSKMMWLLNQVTLLSQQVWMPEIKMARWNAPMAPSAPQAADYCTVLGSPQNHGPQHWYMQCI